MTKGKDTRVEKIINLFKNNRITSIIIVIGLSISAISGVISSIKEVMPQNGEKRNQCKVLENSYSVIFGEINKINGEEMTFSSTFHIRKLLQSFIYLQAENNELKCQSVQVDFKNQIVKDKVMKIVFSQIEYWKKLEDQSLNTDNVKEVVKSICESLLDFMLKTKQENKQEFQVIKNTIESCQIK